MARADGALGVRAANRVRLERAILNAATGIIKKKGASALTIRGVAAKVDLAPSALYRYYPGLDALLTALIVAAYRDVEAAAARAAERAAREPAQERALAVALAVRRWAIAHPHRYSLIYGTPVPGYKAPTDTVDPASGVGRVLIGVLGAGGQPHEAPADDDAGRASAVDAETAAAMGIPPHVAVHAIRLWTHLFGMISFELFGHWVNVVADPEEFFTAEVRRLVADVMEAAGTA
ncbi:MAG: TetR/AcrR family transcriptional regulator [bacterium]|nr:TetR/AcrR family transcriptional regulator [bacterium]